MCKKKFWYVGTNGLMEGGVPIMGNLEDGELMFEDEILRIDYREWVKIEDYWSRIDKGVLRIDEFYIKWFIGSIDLPYLSFLLKYLLPPKK